MSGCGPSTPKNGNGGWSNFPGSKESTKPVPDRLPKVDPATQEMRLRYWQDVLHKLDDIPRAQLSPEEQINYDVYRPEIENFCRGSKIP